MDEERFLYPIVVTGNSIEEVAKVKRDACPAHYTFKIDSLSQLLEFLSRTGSNKYESCDFEVAGYKWKLSLYPNGDSKRNGSNHISLYLVLSKKNNVSYCAEVNAFFKLFAYDQVQDQYLTMQDVSKKPTRFHAMKTKCGFPRFLSLATFNDASNGYLVNDCCVFGVEIFVMNFTGKVETVSVEKSQKVTLLLANFAKLVKEVCTSKAKAVKETRPIYPVALTHGYVEDTEVAKAKRDAPPAHYTFKIESFSELTRFLSKRGLKKYESREFEVSGYKWKLSFYPDGDTKRNGINHISLYLALSETNDPPFVSEVNAFFKLFVYDQIRDQYLTVQDVSEKPMRFHAMKTECGFPRFLPLSTFKNVSSGYLVNNCCIFGAEIFVTNCTGKGESVSFKIPQETITFTLKNFSKLDSEFYRSNPFNIAGINWCLKVFPKGTRVAKDKYFSAFLEFPFSHLLEQKVSVDFKLRLKNQTGELHLERTCKCCFSGSYWDWGYTQLLLLSDLKDQAQGYMVDDTITVEAEIFNVVSVKEF